MNKAYFVRLPPPFKCSAVPSTRLFVLYTLSSSDGVALPALPFYLLREGSSRLVPQGCVKLAQTIYGSRHVYKTDVRFGDCVLLFAVQFLTMGTIRSLAERRIACNRGSSNMVAIMTGWLACGCSDAAPFTISRHNPSSVISSESLFFLHLNQERGFCVCCTLGLPLTLSPSSETKSHANWQTLSHSV
jgi:hypothetical protein